MPLISSLSSSKRARRVNEAAGHELGEYDVVIIGGGTAGCVLAARLSEDPSIQVLLVEAGESSLKNPLATIPVNFPKLMLSKHDWSIYTVPQPHAASQPKYWPRAKLLGGCTCMNAMIYHIGAPEDYDEWAALQKGQEGASQWAFKEMNNYIKKYEKFTGNTKYPNVDASLRGTSGPVHIGFGYAAKGTSEFLKACSNIGIPHVADLNTAEGTLGVSKCMNYISPKGRRMTAEYAYLTADVSARPNLKVITNAHVTRILLDNSGPSPRAVGVEFTQHSKSKLQVKARKEVILSAGAVNSPQILMLSGIGPADHLKAHDIPIVADLPGVGSHLMDHIVIDLNFLDKMRSGVSHLRRDTIMNQLKTIGSLITYKLTGGGPLTSNIAEAIGFVRSLDPKLFPPSEHPPEEIEDMTSGPGAPDIELFFTSLGYQPHLLTPMRPKHHFGLHGVLLRPKSTGTIRLRSSNPEDPPEVDPQYLTAPNDVATLVRAVRLLMRLLRTPPLASMVDEAGVEDPKLDHGLEKILDDDSALEDVVRRKAETLYHPACTARMAPQEDGGVLDPFLRVHGVPNLRVVDASVFPMIVSGHTAAPVLAIAEKAADLIKAAVSGAKP